jgi:hypothetical protein
MITRSSVSKYLSLLLLFWLLMLAYSKLGALGHFNLGIYTYDFSLQRLLIAHFVLLFFSFLIPTKPTKASDFFLWLHLLFPLVPTLVFFSFSGGNGYFLFLCTFAFFAISILVKIPFAFTFHSFAFRKSIGMVWLCLVLIYLFILLNGDYLSLDYSWENIYNNRVEISVSQPPIFEYFHTLLSKSLFPFLLLFYFLRGKTFLLLILVVFSLLVFFISQHRAALFYPILTLVCYYSSKLAVSRAGWSFFIIFSLILIFGILSLNFDKLSFIGDLVLRRTFFAPAILNFQYFEFFQANPNTFFSDSKISFGLIQPVYPVSVPYIISEYIGLPGGHANSSYLGSGYQQAGLLGIVIYVSIIGVFLKLLDSIGFLVGSHTFVFGVCASPLVWLINSSDLPGVFLTHGLLFSLLLLWSCSRVIKSSVFPLDRFR